MGIEAGTRHDIGITHREVLVWSRKAQPGEELRAGVGADPNLSHRAD
jgi:hypothetical protein